MTRFLTVKGAAAELPALLQWNIRLTDGDPCDAFSLSFAFEPEYRGILREADGFFAIEGSRRVFTGVVDDYELSLTKNGCIAEVTGRGLAAKLLDTQVRAAEYISAQIEDILREYVEPCGITEVERGDFPPVANFVVETGYTCWQVLTGFCRHSSGVFPRFREDGTLVLKNEKPTKSVPVRDWAEAAWYSDDRYTEIARQVLINTRNGQMQEARNEPFLARGGSRVRVTGWTGNKIRAVWRTAEQRIEEAEQNARTLSLRLPGCFLAFPGDRVQAEVTALGISGEFTVQAAESACDETGQTCLLTLRE